MSAQPDPKAPQPPQATSAAALAYSDNNRHASSVECASTERGAVAEKGETPLYNAHIDVSGVDERKLLRKLDLYLVPWLSLLCLLSYLDRTSIGNAKVRQYH